MSLSSRCSYNIQLTRSLRVSYDSHSVCDVNIIFFVQMRIAYVTKRCSSVYWLWCNHAYPSLHTNMSFESKWPLCVLTACVTISLMLFFRCFCCCRCSCCCLSAGEISIEYIHHRLLMCPKITVPFFWSTILSSTLLLFILMHFLYWWSK